MGNGGRSCGTRTSLRYSRRVIAVPPPPSLEILPSEGAPVADEPEALVDEHLEELERLTDLRDERLFWFEYTPDGETLVVSSGEYVRDAMLIRDFR